MTKVEIDPEIAESIKNRIEGTKFNSIEEYVNFLLVEVEQRDGSGSAKLENTEEIDIQNHLEDLGYL